MTKAQEILSQAASRMFQTGVDSMLSVAIDTGRMFREVSVKRGTNKWVDQ